VENVQKENGFKMSEEKNKEEKNIEFYGSTIDEAIKNALQELSVSKEELQIKVVSEEKKGLFGMQGEKPAKIIVNFKKNC
jgi:spoIIIJ-associated protein